MYHSQPPFRTSLHNLRSAPSPTPLPIADRPSNHPAGGPEGSTQFGGATEEALAHTIRVAGHAILFATIINAGGFLALTLSDLPPMRQFGIVTSLAFALAMLADFTALPAALWILFRERPETDQIIVEIRPIYVWL